MHVVVALAPNMSTRFSRAMGYAIRGVSTNGRWVAVANETYSNGTYVDAIVFALSGAIARSSIDDAFETHHPFLVSLGLWQP